ncbi:MAG: hypothetical protein FJW46_05630 [Actinobacteria bacterium]|nr:hypothetical protein [Actinomycetota bacterium]
MLVGNEGFETAVTLRATISFLSRINGHEIALSVSIGGARIDPDEDGRPNLFQRADTAIY